MNHRILLSTLLGIAAVSPYAVAGNYLHVLPSSLGVGAEGVLQLQLSADQPWSAFQLELELPEGLTLGTLANGAHAQASHTIGYASVATTRDGYAAYRLVGYSTENASYGSTEGIIVTLPVTASTLTEGTYPVYAHDLLLDNGDVDDEGAALADVQGSYLTVGTPATQDIVLEGSVPGFVCDAMAADATLTSIDLTDATVAQSFTLQNPNAVVYTTAPALGFSNEVVDGECQSLVLTDGYPYGAPLAFHADNVSYQRTVTASTYWGTACLPFPLESDASVKYYQLQRIDERADGTATYIFQSVSRVAAGTPCVFKKQVSGSTTFAPAATGVEILATADDLTDELPDLSDWTMHGTYGNEQFDVTDSQWSGTALYYINGDKFWHATGSLQINTFRGWFEYTGAVSAPYRFGIEEANGADGIELIETSPEEMQLRFDLMGRRVGEIRNSQFIIHN